MREKLIKLLHEAEENVVDACMLYEYCDDCPGTRYGNRCRECLKADHLIANGVTVQEWISVKDRLPKDWKERVLVKIKDANNIIGHPDMDTDRYMGEIWVRWGHNVTHWMPLPQPPKGE